MIYKIIMYNKIINKLIMYNWCLSVGKGRTFSFLKNIIILKLFLDKTMLSNEKSLLNILSAAIPDGARIELSCTGPREQEDLEWMIQTMEGLGACTDDAAQDG